MGVAQLGRYSLSTGRGATTWKVAWWELSEPVCTCVRPYMSHLEDQNSNNERGIRIWEQPSLGCWDLRAPVWKKDLWSDESPRRVRQSGVWCQPKQGDGHPHRGQPSARRVELEPSRAVNKSRENHKSAPLWICGPISRCSTSHNGGLWKNNKTNWQKLSREKRRHK